MRPTTTPPPKHPQPNSMANNFKRHAMVTVFLFLWVYWVTCFQNGEQAWEKTCPQFIDHDWYSLLHKFRSSLHSKGLAIFHKFWQYYYRFCKINLGQKLCCSQSTTLYICRWCANLIHCGGRSITSIMSFFTPSTRISAWFASTLKCANFDKIDFMTK